MTGGGGGGSAAAAAGGKGGYAAISHLLQDWNEFINQIRAAANTGVGVTRNQITLSSLEFVELLLATPLSMAQLQQATL